MRKVLLLPGFGGRGFGHVQCCLALAREFTRQNWETSFVIAGPHAISVQNEGYRIFRPHLMRYPTGQRTSTPAYTFIQNGRPQALRDGLDRSWRVWFSVLEVCQFVKHFKPDVLIGDSSLLTWMVGQRNHLPVFQLVYSIAHPKGPPFIWWCSPPPDIHPIDIRPVFNPVLERWKLKPIDDAVDLLKGDQYLIPGIPSTDPLPEGLNDTNYLGPVIHKPEYGVHLPAVFDNPHGKPILYVSMGGGSSRFSLDLLDTLNSAFGNTALSVVVALGKGISLNSLNKIPPNFHYFAWLPGWEAIQKSNLVLFHGGHSTMMEVVHAGVPAIIIPSQSEQEGNGRRLAACSAGSVISPSDRVDARQMVGSHWKYGEVATWIVPNFKPDSEILRETAFSLLDDPKIRDGTARIKSESHEYGGGPAAVDLINAHIK